MTFIIPKTRKILLELAGLYTEKSIISTVIEELSSEEIDKRIKLLQGKIEKDQE